MIDGHCRKEKTEKNPYNMDGKMNKEDLFHLARRDLLKAFQDMGISGSAIGFFPASPNPFLPRIGLSNIFRTLLKPDPRGPLRTCHVWHRWRWSLEL